MAYQALTKMGVKFTTKPLECTHLVARAIVRTEKFLVAMAVAPHIVTDKWVEVCVSKKKIMRRSCLHWASNKADPRHS